MVALEVILVLLKGNYGAYQAQLNTTIFVFSHTRTIPHLFYITQLIHAASDIADLETSSSLTLLILVDVGMMCCIFQIYISYTEGYPLSY